MKSRIIEERDDYYFEYDNVYNMDADERYIDRGADSSVWYN